METQNRRLQDLVTVKIMQHLHILNIHCIRLSVYHVTLPVEYKYTKHVTLISHLVYSLYIHTLNLYTINVIYITKVCSHSILDIVLANEKL